MVKRSRKTQKTQEQLQGYVLLVFAKDMEQARDYETILKVNDIPVTVGEPDPAAIEAGEIPVMVPEDHLDEAHVIIESQDAFDDFYDFGLEEDDDLDFGGAMFDDEF